MYRTRGAGKHQSSLEVFILALISQGLNTTYAFQSEVGLSLGASVPALKRLEEAGLVTRKISGRRHEFTLTRAGKTTLASWNVDQRRFPTEFEDVLRTAFLNALGDKKDCVSDLFQQAAKARRRAAEELEEEAERLQKDIGIKFDLRAYQWLRTRAEATRLAAEQALLDEASHLIDNKKYRRK
ncbi:MAG TPA: PadR family transcriptional regulator [Candidatus Nanoarchaeia archaeon]|nr:PadR family transcriptional regulator [Candidatus Nanoarchaeia archaeon]